jgi:hypothetical protein
VRFSGFGLGCDGNGDGNGDDSNIGWEILVFDVV